MKRFLQILFVAIYLAVFIIPGYVFFSNEQTQQSIFSSSSLDLKLLTSFRLFGLYAFALVWSQIMLGAFRIQLTKLFGTNMLKLHITSGIFTLLFVTLHPILFYLGMIFSGSTLPSAELLGSYVGNGPLIIYAYFGAIAWTLLMITGGAALLRKNRFLNNYWRYIHYGNYLVFILAFFHSKNIGSDTGLPLMRYLYIFFAVTFIGAIVYKWGYLRLYKKFSLSSSVRNT